MSGISLFHFYFFNFADMLSVSGRSVFVIGDTNKNDFSAKSLERIWIVSVSYLLDCSFGIFVPFQLNNKYRIT